MLSSNFLTTSIFKKCSYLKNVYVIVILKLHGIILKQKSNSVHGSNTHESTFRFTCSPFLLAAVVDQHLRSWEVNELGKVAEILRSLYADDLISGKPTVAGAMELKKTAIKIFNDATFTLHKWHSNEPNLEDDQIKLECKVALEWNSNQVDPQVQQTFAKTQPISNKPTRVKLAPASR